MARLIVGNSNASFGQGIFGSISRKTMDFLSNQIAQVSTDTAIGRKLAERSRALFEEISSTKAVQLADAILQMAESGMGQDIIETLTTVQQMQNAAPVMQGWIMENPYIREMASRGLIEAYGETYVDPEPGVEGEARSAYQQLWHGVRRPHETQAWTASYYAGRSQEDAMALSIRRIASIVDTQESAEWLMRNGDDDVTSQYGAKL